MNLPKVAFLTSAALCIIAASLYAGITLNHKQIITHNDINKFNNYITNVKNELSVITGITPTHFIRKAKYKGHGVTINKKNKTNQSDYIFISSFFDNSNELRLIKRDGTIINRWPVSFSHIFKDTDKSLFMEYPATDWNIDIHGSKILPNGSIIFNFEYGGTVKLDKCGNLEWKLAGYNSHHSIAQTDDGDFWTLGSHKAKDSAKYKTIEGIRRKRIIDGDDTYNTLIKINGQTGKVIEEIDILSLFLKNPELTARIAYNTNYRTLLFKTTNGRNEATHPNTVKIINNKKYGDLLISFADHNMIATIDLENKEIKWLKQGPWFFQHDPIIKDNHLYVFSNLTVKDGNLTPNSSIMKHNLDTDKTEILYGDGAKEPFKSKIRGKIDLRPNGNILVTEFDNGRLFEFNNDREIVWEFLNKYDDKNAAEITQARAHPASYFTVKDWTCPTNLAIKD